MRRLILVLAGFLFAIRADALGLGDITVRSALNERLNAEIKLYSLSASEFENVQVRLASRQDFAKAGIERAWVLTRLRFEVALASDGTPVIKVSSRDLIREPFLDFLVEVIWPSGRMLREYTVLLDPPVLMQRRPAVVSVPAARPQPAPAPAAVSPAPEQELFPRTDISVSAPSAPVAGSVAGGEYQTQRNDTLWSIASAARPDAAVTVEQMMLALLRVNPDAFYNGNINDMKAGQVLRIPDRAEATSLNTNEARAEVRRQYEVWREAQAQGMPVVPVAEAEVAAPEPAPAAEAVPEPVSAAAPGPATEAEVKIVTPRPEETAAAAESGAAGAAEAEVEMLSEQLALANEARDTAEQENTELRSRLAEMEEQVESMQRLLSLKDDDLANLQNKLNELQAQLAGESVAPTVETAAVPAGSDAVTTETATETAAEPETAEIEPAPAEEPAGEPEQVAGLRERLNPYAVQPVPAPTPEAVVAPPPTPEPVVEPAPAMPTTPATEAPHPVVGFIQELTKNPLALGGAAGALLLLVGGFAWAARRRRMESLEFPESILSGKEEAAAEAAPVASEETSLISDFASTSAELDSEVAEVDPLTEADVFLAYKRYGQAEDMLTTAVAEAPDRLDLKVKLMEVYAATENREAFESLAEEVHSSLDGQSSALWEKVLTMGLELAPDNPLFGGQSNVTELAAAEAPAGIDDESAALGLDEAEGGERDLREALATGEVEAEEHAALDFDLAQLAAGEEMAGEEERGEAEEKKAFQDLDFDLEELGVETAELTDAASPPAAKESVADLTSLELEPSLLDELTGAEESELAEHGTRRNAGIIDEEFASDFDLDLETLEEERATEGSDQGSEEVPLQEDAAVVGIDEVATKLDLARAYIDMGDPEGARGILDEVLSEGNDQQKNDAEYLLAQI